MTSGEDKQVDASVAPAVASVVPKLEAVHISDQPSATAELAPEPRSSKRSQSEVETVATSPAKKKMAERCCYHCGTPITDHITCHCDQLIRDVALKQIPRVTQKFREVFANPNESRTDQADWCCGLSYELQVYVIDAGMMQPTRQYPGWRRAGYHNYHSKYARYFQA